MAHVCHRKTVFKSFLNGDTRMTNAANETSYAMMKNIFETLEAHAPHEARDIRSAFHDVWEYLYYLSEYLDHAASRLHGEQREVLTQEYQLVQTAIETMSKSSLPAIMPDETESNSAAPTPTETAERNVEPVRMEEQPQPCVSQPPAADAVQACSRTTRNNTPVAQPLPAHRRKASESPIDKTAATLRILDLLRGEVEGFEFDGTHDPETTELCSLAIGDLHDALRSAADAFYEQLRL